jgi:Rrf2 family transcriptional regulator, cysteine metabolism repressor
MGFSQKTVYALRAIYELAKRYGQGAVSIPLIAEAQNVPPRFLENILLQLKQAGIVESLRGREGGYALARTPDLVKVGDVLRAIEGPMYPVSCLGDKAQETCPMRQDCVFIPMWREAQEAMLAVYDGTSFEDLVARGRASEEESAPMYSI